MEATNNLNLYRDFCLLAIHCIQLTTPLLSERKLTDLFDEPYSEQYFLYLINKIKRDTRHSPTTEEDEEKG